MEIALDAQRPRWKAYVELTKPRVVALMVFTVVVGMLLGYIGRLALSDTIRDAGIGDRLGGAALGAIRVGLVATTLVLVFDQIVPANRQPPFLAGSHLRPLFSTVGQMGFKSLPPEAAAAIDRLKRDRHI